VNCIVFGKFERGGIVWQKHGGGGRKADALCQELCTTRRFEYAAAVSSTSHARSGMGVPPVDFAQEACLRRNTRRMSVPRTQRVTHSTLTLAIAAS
jgi:hypothetical protein